MTENSQCHYKKFQKYIKNINNEFYNNNLIIFKHTAAVKALAFNPHQRGVLLSGGGNNDKTI